MPRGLDYLRDQAIRLRRTKWPNAPMLGDELYLILQGIDPPITDVATTDELGNPITVPFLDLPELDLTPFDLDFPENPVADTPTVDPVPFDPDTPISSESPGGEGGVNDPDTNPGAGGTVTSRVVWQRSSFPGQVLSRIDSGSTFSVRIYPNHFIDTTSQRTVTARITDTSAADDVEDDTWVTVFMAVKYTSTITQLGSISSSGSLQATNVSYVFNPPPSTNQASVFPGKITSGTGDTYTVDIYENGLDGEATSVTVTQMQIDGDSEIPVDSWAAVLKNTYTNDDGDSITEYTMQVPVWL